MYDELVKRLRERAGAVDYDGRPDIACDYEQAADAIEELLAERDEVNADSWKTAFEVERDEHRWIPVTEEPPLKVGDDGYNGYLVYANGYYEVADYTTDKFDNVPYFHVNGEYEPDVTNYMPLPEPPKEE